jgi:predicted phosphodiesterase
MFSPESSEINRKAGAVRIGIFSDVHGNLEALEVVLNALEGENIDRIICVGDLVGYGPDPNRCIKKVLETADVTVAGNHDYAAIELTPLERFNEYARDAIKWTRKVLNSTSLKLLKKLPLIESDEGVTIVHASLEAPDEWNYVLSDDEAYRNLMALTTQFCFVGHSHIPVAFIRDEHFNVLIQKADEIMIEPTKMYLINVGSVGQPRDGDPRTVYGVLDIDVGKFQLKRIQYPVEKVQKKMADAGLPKFLIERLAVGH